MGRTGAAAWILETRTLDLETRGRDQVLDLTPEVRTAVAEAGLREGQALIFVPGATASVTTLEFEPGLVQDTAEVLERLAPAKRDWAHHRTWGDDNGGAHLRAMLLGPSLAVPVLAGALTLGTWQQIVLIDHDTRPRRRRVVIQVSGQC